MYIPTVIPSRWINQWSDIPSCRALLIPLQGNHMIVHQHIGSGVPEVGGQGFTCAEAIWSGARTLLRSQGAYLWPWGLCRAIHLPLEVTCWLLCRVVEENDRFACLKVSWEQLPKWAQPNPLDFTAFTDMAHGLPQRNVLWPGQK